MKEHLLSQAERIPNFKPGTNTLDLTGEEADAFFDALASETSRGVFESLYDEPSTPSELADEFDTSVQNIHYHLKKLAAADLVESVETVYSSRGREVDVYAPTHEAVVLVTGEESTVSRVKSLLRRFVGVLAILLVGTVLIHMGLTGGADLELGGSPPLHDPGGTRTASPPADHSSGGNGGDAVGDTQTGDVNKSLTGTETSPMESATTPITPVGESHSLTVQTIPRSIFFLSGGTIALLLVVGGEFWRRG